MPSSTGRTRAIKLAARDLRKVKKDLKAKPKGRQMQKKNATIVLAQGAVAVPKKNFGTKAFKGNSARAMIKALDARLPRTLGLPRAVGPSTVIRTTRLISSSAKFVMFAPFYDTSVGKWLDWCGIESVVGTSDVTAASNTLPINMPLAHLESACQIVPAALTVQVMNAASLQSAMGVFAMTRVNQQLDLGSSVGISYDEMAARVISFYSPRMLTGGKLSLRGVKCSAYPLDMSEYSDFASIVSNSGALTWDNSKRPSALSPIVIAQENTTSQALEYMVTIEWRVRFDPGNPATASHTYHDSLPDAVWNDVIKMASAAGHGVEELSEDVAAAGEAI